MSFDAPLDLDNLESRHQDSDFKMMPSISSTSPSCKRFGEEVYLDMGSGRFPATHYGRARLKYDEQAPDGYRFDGKNPFFDFDPQAAAKNLLLRKRTKTLTETGVYLE